MEQALTAAPRRANFPIILATAALQGWALYGLHRAIVAQSWPATDHAWLFAFYAIAVFLPLTVEMLAERATEKAMWASVVLLAVALFYVGWHDGADVDDSPMNTVATPIAALSFALLLGILWLHALPFLQARLAARKWTLEYPYLFAYSWRNVITIAEALVFTGCFWLLLLLWEALFHLLKIDFFRELFEKPLFIYPVTSVVFGCALHLIGSIDRFVSAVLEQILNVFKWLGTVTGALLGLFTLALLIKLPGLVMTSHQTIGAGSLLWLVAVVVLFFNAAYRDGTTARPYPQWIAGALKFLVPLTVVIALTATYALYARTAQHGLTVERIWAFIVAGAALIYSIGYSISACNKRVWFGGVRRVNVLVALCLIAVLALALTPVMSPYRLSANSQYRLILAGRYESTPSSFPRASPFQYLRFDSGAYGRRRLAELAQLRDRPDSARIQELANAALKSPGLLATVPAPLDVDVLSGLQVFPAGRAPDGELSAKLRSEYGNRQNIAGCYRQQGQNLTGLFVDLDGDGTDEFVLWNTCGRGILYQQRGGSWVAAGTVSDPTLSALGFELNAELAGGHITAVSRPWQDLQIGQRRFQVTPYKSATVPQRPPLPKSSAQEQP